MMHFLSAKQIAYAALGVALIAVCSWISIPSFLPAMVPFTLQTFAICLLAALFGLRLGLWTVFCYIMLGLIGAPVFSGFRGGFAALLGPTGGYIVGFLFTALTVGFAADRIGRETPALLISMVIGILMCYAFGTLWFKIVYTKNNGSIDIYTTLSWCVFPYLFPDGIKIAMARFLTRRLHAFVQRRLKS